MEDAVVRPSTIEARAYIPEPRVVVTRIIQRVVDTSATPEDYQKLLRIVKNAQQQNAEPEQVESRIRESTPFGGLVQLLPKDRAELYAFLAVLVAIVQLVVSLRAPETKTITPEQVEQIIERVVDEIEKQPAASEPSPPPPSPAPRKTQEKKNKPKKQSEPKQQERRPRHLQ
jgi:hypothetical protein